MVVARSFPLAVLVALSFIILPGDQASASHYFLRFPWAYGASASILQGYNSAPTHVNGNYFALDFQVSGGSTLAAIAATAGGPVVFVDNGNYGCDLPPFSVPLIVRIPPVPTTW